MIVASKITMNPKLQKLLSKPNLRIVTIVRDHMSGLLYAVPNLRILRQQFPGAHITLLANPYAMPILKGCPYVDEMLPFFQFRQAEGPFARAKGLLRKAQAWLKLVGRVDLVVHFRWTGPETLLFCSTLGLPFQVGYNQDGLNQLLDLYVGREDLVNDSTRKRNARVIEAMGFPPFPMHMEMWISREEANWAENFLQEHGYDPTQPIFAMHPGSHWGCNEWLPERWSALANGLLAKYGGQVVLTGTEEERPLTETIARNIAGRVINAAGTTNLPQFAALLNRANLVISVDTAPTQICQALNIPAVILMGAGNKTWTSQEPEQNIIILQDEETADDEMTLCNFGAGTCHNSFCRSRLAGIQLRRVLHAAEKLLTEQAVLA